MVVGAILAVLMARSCQRCRKNSYNIGHKSPMVQVR